MDDSQEQELLRQRGPLPGHIAIIMDGNGRWARERGLPRVQGHHEGAASVRDIAEASAQLGIRHLTLYTFSTENWFRPASEVNALMQLLIRTLRKEAETLHRNNIRLDAIGDTVKLPPVCQRELEEVKRSTADHDRMTIHLALSYSGRWDINQAAKRIAQAVSEGALKPEDVDEDLISEMLDTHGTPDPDLMIRTGGEIRISNFLLWQAAYSELFFSDIYWPAFRRNALYGAIRGFQDRERRFGRVET